MRLTVEGAVLIARNQSPALVQKRLALLATHGELLGSEPRTASREQPRFALLHR
jgi:hypothetical protein